MTLPHWERQPFPGHLQVVANRLEQIRDQLQALDRNLDAIEAGIQALYQEKEDARDPSEQRRDHE